MARNVRSNERCQFCGMVKEREGEGGDGGEGVEDVSPRFEAPLSFTSRGLGVGCRPELPRVNGGLN